MYSWATHHPLSKSKSRSCLGWRTAQAWTPASGQQPCHLVGIQPGLSQVGTPVCSSPGQSGCGRALSAAQSLCRSLCRSALGSRAFACWLAQGLQELAPAVSARFAPRCLIKAGSRTSRSFLGGKGGGRARLSGKADTRTSPSVAGKVDEPLRVLRATCRHRSFEG